MSSYRTIVVGTDGSDTSYRAVDRAAELARDAGARLVIACAYNPAQHTGRAEDILGPDAYQVIGSTPAEETVRTAHERAAARGASEVETVVVEGKAADVLGVVAKRSEADLLVVGNRGLNTLAGRIIGSVPLEVARRTPTDVLIVHTTR